MNFNLLSPFLFAQYKWFCLEFVQNAIRKIEIRRGHAIDNDGFQEPKQLAKTLETSDCFEKKPGKRPWVTFQIPWSIITHVNILSVNKGEGE